MRLMLNVLIVYGECGKIVVLAKYMQYGRITPIYGLYGVSCTVVQMRPFIVTSQHYATSSTSPEVNSLKIEYIFCRKVLALRFLKIQMQRSRRMDF